MRRAVALAAALVLVLLLAPSAAAGTAARPFVYVVVIDGLDGDKVEAGDAPYISSLLAGDEGPATYFPGSRSVMPAVTNSNHVAMMSGAYADRSGIAGNAFALYAPLASEDSCTPTGPFDLGAMPSETSGESLTCPEAEMTFEAIKRQAGSDPPTTAAIFGKPKLGRIFAGSNVTPGTRDVDYLWAPCASGPDDDDYCESVPTNPVTGYALDDSVVMDEVVRTIEEGVTARESVRRPELTFVNLPQVDSAGHAFGTSGPYDEAIALADDEIERLVTTLKVEGIWEQSVLILVSDHSMDTTSPDKVSLVAAFDDAGIPADSYLPVNGDNGSAEHVYLADRLDEGRFELLRAMREAALATQGVGRVLYREPNPADGNEAHTLDRRRRGWHLAGERTGDLFAVTRRGFGFSDPDPQANPVIGNHGAPQTRDNFLAVVGGGTGLVHQGEVTGGGRRAHPVNVDIAPTVMALFGLQPPADNRGLPMTAAFEPGVLGR